MTRKALLLPLLAVVLGTAAGAQEADTKEERKRALFDGTHVLRRILYDHEFGALDKYEDLADDPSRTLLVALGDLDVLDKVPGGLRGFVRRGGALLAASDRAVVGEAREQLLAVSGVRVNQETLVSNLPVDCYFRQPFCPRVHAIEGRTPDLFHEPGINGPVELQVYANIPSVLLFSRKVPNIEELAFFPPGMALDGGGKYIPQRHPLLFAVGGNVGKGRVLVLADHSVFINQMMLPTDTGNVEFSYNAVRWLQGERPKRDRVLFVEDGKIQTKLDIPLKSITIPPEEMAKLLFAKRNELLIGAEEMLTRFEDEDAFNRRLFDALYDVGWPPERLLRVGLLVGSLALLVFFAYRVGVRARFRHETTVPLLTATVGRHLPEEPLVEQRRAELLKRGNLREPAAVLTRRWFANQGLDAATAQAPAFTVTGGWYRRWRLRRKLSRLWRLAAGRAPLRVTPAELWRLQRELDQLHADRERGAWGIAS